LKGKGKGFLGQMLRSKVPSRTTSITCGRAGAVTGFVVYLRLLNKRTRVTVRVAANKQQTLKVGLSQYVTWVT